jgi:hypothetical protein
MPLKSFHEHEMEEQTAYRQAVERTGVACDHCGTELIFSDNIILTSFPPKRRAHCPDQACAATFMLTV